MSETLTIGNMLDQTPFGEARLFKAPIQGVTEERFACVRFNSEYVYPLEWDIGLSLPEIPRMAARSFAPISLSALSKLEIFSDVKIDRMVDFYTRGSSIFLISNCLMDVFENLDPGSLSHRPVVIQAKDGDVDFNLVMPKRSLEAIDLDRTDVLIKGEQAGEFWVKRVQFPNAVVFQKGELSGIHNFSDIDVFDWLWSRELIDAAKVAGIKGPYFKLLGDSSAGDFDRL